MPDYEPDAAAIGDFVKALFTYADNESFASIRAFYQSDAGKAPPYISGVQINGGGLDPVIKAAITTAREAANYSAPLVFAPPIATFSNRGRAAEDTLINGLCISVELDAGDTAKARAFLEGLLGPATVVVASGGEWADPATGQVFPKLHLHWRLSEPTRAPAEHATLKYARGLACALVGADPSAKTIVHPLRWPGSWHLKSTPRLASTVALTPTAEVHLQDAVEALEDAAEAAGLAQQALPAAASDGEPEAPLWVVESALDAITNDNEHWDDWNSRIGLTVYAATAGSPGGLDAWMAWSAKSDKFMPGACAERWAHFHSSPPSRCSFGTLHFLAARAGWQRPVSEQQHRQRRERDKTRTRRQADEPKEQPAEQPQQLELDVWIDDAGWVEADIPKRRWIVPGYLLRGAITLLAGPPSGFKSSLMLAWAAAIVLNRPFGRFVPRVQGPVIVYNTEDDADEQRRRLSAVLRQFGAVPADVAGKLIRIGPQQVGTLLERDKKTGGFTRTGAMARIADLCRRLSKEGRSVKALLAAHGFHGDAQKAVLATLMQERDVEIARVKIASNIRDGLRAGSQPRAAWVPEAGA